VPNSRRRVELLPKKGPAAPEIAVTSGSADRLEPRRYAALPVLAYVTVALIFDAELFRVLSTVPTLWADATSLWNVHLSNLYGQAMVDLEGVGPFRYSPMIALLAAPLHSLPWSVYLWGLIVAQAAAILAMGGRRAWLIFIFPPVLLELADGNVHIFMAAAIVLGFRWPAAWAFLLLTKVTPGVGVLWFAFRQEWRSLAIALGPTVALAAASALIAPDLWGQWFRALVVMNGLPNPTLWPPLLIRLPFAVGLIWWAARTDRRWLLPVAAFLALPTIWANSSALLAGSIALGTEIPSRPTTEPVAVPVDSWRPG
jgi:hypothetical protein